MSQTLNKTQGVDVVYYEENIFAIIIRASFKREGIEFLTPSEFSQQLGYMKRPKGYLISPHIHKIRNDTVQITNETLIIRKGKVRVDFYNLQKEYFESQVVKSGDVILLAQGGHGFEMLEPSEIIEVKQGPYNGDTDKERF